MTQNKDEQSQKTQQRKLETKLEIGMGFLVPTHFYSFPVVMNRHCSAYPIPRSCLHKA